MPLKRILMSKLYQVCVLLSEKQPFCECRLRLFNVIALLTLAVCHCLRNISVCSRSFPLQGFSKHIQLREKSQYLVSMVQLKAATWGAESESRKYI